MNGYHKNGSKLAPSNYLEFICISFNSIQIFTISFVLPKFHPILWNSESNINKFPCILIFRLCFCLLHALSDIVVCWQCFPWRPYKLKYWFSHKSGSRSNTAKPWFLPLSKPQLLWESCHQISTTTIYFLFCCCYLLASPDIPSVPPHFHHISPILYSSFPAWPD